jgi:hypothetical protein|tara:strand:- start:402 stop:941 length:540 start_codon:yes stop_codon:yes gene_type:complete
LFDILLTSLFSELSDCARFIILTRIEVPANTRAPDPGLSILQPRSFLKKYFTTLIQNEDMNGTMKQMFLMNYRPFFLTDYLILPIDNVKQLVIPLWNFAQRMWVVAPAKLYPLSKIQFLCPSSLCNTKISSYLRPFWLCWQSLSKLLTPLGKSPTDQFVKKASVIDRELVAPRADLDYR